MQVGFIGLGKMGGNMALRLVEAVAAEGKRVGHTVVGYAPDPNPELRGIEGLTLTHSIDELLDHLSPPRVVWLMVPAGDATENVIHDLAQRLQPGDIVIDGGNSYFKDTLRRAEGLQRHGIALVDCGTSGGVWGRREGYCLMIGGDERSVATCRPLFESLAPEKGWAHVGPSGAGHFVKMVHNGIEYGIMEAYGEGFQLMRKSRFPLDLHQVAEVWNHGSVIRSWLLELAEQFLDKDGDLSTIQPYVEDSGEGRWMVSVAMEESVPVPVIAASLFARFESRDRENFSARFCSALRKQFGGHDVVRKDVTEKAQHRQIGAGGHEK
jgi:6-phosphogluconate dehydrogenase